MVQKTIHARGSRGSQSIEGLVEKARTQQGVERILVVYEQESAHIYVEGGNVRQKPAARAS